MEVIGFVLGFGVTLLLIVSGKAYGAYQERSRTPLQIVKDTVEERVAKLERKVAEQDLAILDAVERVAHKLQDRQRKRREAAAEEIGDVDEIPNDPNMLLAQARAAYPLNSQLSLMGGGE